MDGPGKEEGGEGGGVRGGAATGALHSSHGLLHVDLGR